jgi:hypothetical protein
MVRRREGIVGRWARKRDEQTALDNTGWDQSHSTYINQKKSPDVTDSSVSHHITPPWSRPTCLSSSPNGAPLLQLNDPISAAGPLPECLSYYSLSPTLPTLTERTDQCPRAQNGLVR